MAGFTSNLLIDFRCKVLGFEGLGFQALGIEGLMV